MLNLKKFEKWGDLRDESSEMRMNSEVLNLKKFEKWGDLRDESSEMRMNSG